MKRSLFILVTILTVAAFLVPVLPTQTAAAQAGNGYDLINAVNQLRASLGLSALQVDPILMSIAQGQSDYQASIGTWSHEGPGGSSPRDRAIAAGFGGGATVFISENVAVMNTSASFDTLIYSIWSDQLHWNTMTNVNYTHAGAGVTVADGEVYYTLDVGYIAGNPGSYVPAPSYTPGGPQAAATEATPNWISPVITATPHDDGEVVHVSEAGQSLWSIAIAYGTTIKDIIELNGLDPDNPVIWPGDELIIRPALDATITPTPTITQPLPTRTPTPTRTVRPTSTKHIPTQTPTPTPVSGLNIQLPSIYSFDKRQLGIGIIALCSLGLITVFFIGFKSKK
jgi:uncharacterized protein YkwD/LysM repeat protein